MNQQDKDPPEEISQKSEIVKKFVFFALIGLGSFAIKVLLSTGGVELEIAAKNMGGVGWEEARGDLEREYRASLLNLYPELSEASIASYVTCMHEHYLPWLNESGCSYLYNTLRKTESEHLSEQTQCFEDKGRAEAFGNFDLICSAKSFPNTWSTLESAIADGFRKSYTKGAKERNEKLNLEIPNCAAKKYVDFLNTSDCKPFNQSVTDAKSAMSTCEREIEKSPDFNSKVERIWRDCYATSH